MTHKTNKPDKLNKSNIIRRNTVILSFYLLLVTGYNLYAWSPVSPDIDNRGYFHLRKGEEFFDKEEYRKAIKEFNLACKFSFNSIEKNKALGRKVNALMEEGNCEEALETIGELKLKGEKENEILFLKAECLRRLNNTTQAINILDVLIAQEHHKENRIFFQIKEGLLFLSLDSLRRAEKTFLNVLNDIHSDEDEVERNKEEELKLVMYSLGYINLKKGNFEDAKKYFQFLVKNFKNEEVGYKSSLYLALILEMDGKEDEAMNVLNSMNTKNRSEVSAMKGFLFYGEGSFKWAKEEFQSIEEDTILNKEIRKMTTILSAECCYLLKDYNDAVRFYRRYNKMVNTSLQKKPALYGLAWSYFKLGQYSNAYAVLKDFLVLYPESPFLLQIERLSALSLFYVGAHREAKFHFTKLLNLGAPLKNRDRIYYLRGKSEFYLREFDQARSDFLEIISSFPSSRWKPHAMNMIARISFEKEEYLKAYNTYKELLTMELPPSILDEVRFQTERCRLYLGYYKNPIEMSKAFVRKYPQSPKSTDLQLEVAEFYYQLQKYWEAIREYERFLNLFPGDKNNRFVLYKLARSYSQIGYYEKAINIYLKISEGDDQYAESALISMGDILFSQERYKESINAFKELTKKFPESNMLDYANFIIGKNYLELNLPKEARVSFELVVNSKRVFPLKEKAKLLIGKTFYIEGKGEEYLAYLDKMIKTGSRTLKARSYFLKAEYKKEIGRFKEAMELYEQSSTTYEEVTDKVRALYEAGLSAEELKLFTQAMDFYKRALAISPLEAAKFRIEERIKRIEVIKGKGSKRLD